jgi:ABC-type sugar transport system ATPase subunit
MSMADRIVVLNNGIKIQEGSPRDLYDNPEHVFVATFLGSPAMNTFRFRKSTEDPKLFILDSTTEVSPFGLEFADKTLPDELTVGIRPNDFILSDDGEIKVVLQSLEFLGSVIQMRVKLGDSELIITVSRESRTKTDIYDLKPESPLRFSVSSERFYIFGPDDRRLKNPIIKVHPPEAIMKKTQGK